jgi:hypothetical protein
VIDLTVVTPTLPERRPMLHELRQCIARQTVKPRRWVVKTDWSRIGPSKIVNDLVADCDTEWVFRCDDDDLFDSNHFEVLSDELTDDYDVVYTWPRVDPPGWIGETGLQMVGTADFLRQHNFIASAAAVRRSLWLELGGYRDVHNEDHDLWVRCLDAGARFCLIPTVTWTYRLGDWPHLSQPESS